VSQMKIYNILKELGGKASTAEVRILAKKKYPNKALHKYVSSRLATLRRNRIIKRSEDGLWAIIKQNPIWTSAHKVDKYRGDK